MKKGVTPVIAVVLLLGITVAAVGSYYAFFQNTVPNESNSVPEINTNNLAKESCWNEGSNAFISVRNAGQSTVNLTRLTVKLNGQTIQPEPSPQIISSGETSTLKLPETYISSGQSVTMIGETEKSFACNIGGDKTPPTPGNSPPTLPSQ